MMMLVNGAGFGAVVWSQSIQVLPNTTYNFSAWGVNVCCRSGWISTYGNTNPAELAFQFNGVQLGTSFTAATPGEWTQFSGTWFSGEDTSLSLTIRDLNPNENGNDFALDDIMLQGPPSAVPIHPSAAAQFVAGLGLIGLLMWRRKQKTARL